jgi:hypothetical protein
MSVPRLGLGSSRTLVTYKPGGAERVLGFVGVLVGKIGGSGVGTLAADAVGDNVGVDATSAGSVGALTNNVGTGEMIALRVGIAGKLEVGWRKKYPPTAAIPTQTTIATKATQPMMSQVGRLDLTCGLDAVACDDTDAGDVTTD